MQKISLARYGEGAYQCYRIPGIISTTKGTFLAYYEERLNGNDWSARNIGIRRSTDEGIVWSACTHVLSESLEDTINNPVMIACKLVKTPSGDFLFSNCANTSTDGKRAPRKHLTLRRSINEGITWSSVVEIEEFAGYSDLAVSPDGSCVYCFYEKDWVKNDEDLPAELCIAKIDICEI